MYGFLLLLALLNGFIPMLTPVPDEVGQVPGVSLYQAGTVLPLGSDPPDHTIIIHTPVGRQFLVLGMSAGVWLGMGSITSLTAEGDLGEPVGEFTDPAVSVGPAYFGLMHIITPRLFLEGRFGLGMVWFSNDRLISRDLSAEGDPHLGFTLSAEVRGRTVTDSGLTASLGINLSRVGLPEDAGAYLGVSPSVGYLSWEEGYDGFWLVEVGYTYPLINGLIPEVSGAELNSPIESRWHMFALTVEFGL